MSTKELAVKQEAAVMTASEMNDWGVPTSMSTQDMVIPKILPMQGLSQLVSDGIAKMGEFRDSISNELLGSIDAPVELIPFFLQKAWDIMEEDGKGNYKWARTVPLIDNPVAAGYNDNWTWEGEENGVAIKRVRRMNFFVLVRSQIGTGAMPYVLSFKSTSLKEGKKLFTEMYVRGIRAGLPPAAHSYMLGGKKEKNDKGTFVVPTMTRASRTNPEELQECLHWIRLINSGAAKVDNSDVEGADNAPTGETGDF